MKRREFLGLVGGAAAAWPFAARAQERTRRIGFLTASFGIDDPEMQTRNSAFVLALREFGWAEGKNVRVEFRSGAGKASELRKHAADLVSLADVVLANGGQAVSVLQDVSRTVPIVFVQVPDPVGAGFVDSLARPGGNATGFTNFEYGIVAKWLDLLKEVAPTVRQVAVLRDPSNAAGSGQWGAIQLFVNLAARHKLPAVYPHRYWIAGGGLVGYAPNIADQYRQAAGYVSRILKGEKPADLPVQVPTKYHLAVNLKTAKALDLTVPPTLLARADEVIE